MITVDFTRLGIKPSYKILDVGCGTGRHTSAASRFKDVTVIGTDIKYTDSVEARNRIVLDKKYGFNGGGKFAILTSDIKHLPFNDESFDIVICSEVLEHIPDHEKAIGEITRVLKSSSNLIISVPRYLPEKICWMLSDEYHDASDGHIRIYKKMALISRLKKAGLTQWSFHFAHSFHTPFWWLKCLLGPSREDSKIINMYHRFLVWQMMKGPNITKFLEKMLNPIMGKSLVLYLRKGKNV
jgi:SAM-dependent methyltransferase